MLYSIEKEPKGQEYKKLIEYAIKRSDAIMYTIRRDRYIKCSQYEILNKISKILNVKINDIELNYKNYIENRYEYLYKKIDVILGEQMDLINAIHASSKCNIDEIIKERLIYNIELEINSRKNLLIQEENSSKLKEILKKYLIEQRHDSEWEGMKIIVKGNVNNYKYGNKYMFDVCKYKICAEIQEYLLNKVDSLYAFNPPYFPEDITFFKDGVAWLVTVTHEKIGTIDINSDEEYKELIKIGLKLNKY